MSAATNEWRAGRIAGARHIPLGYLADRLDEIPRMSPVVVHCAAGARSSIGASLLARAASSAINLHGGFNEWFKAGLPVDTDEVRSEKPEVRRLTPDSVRLRR